MMNKNLYRLAAAVLLWLLFAQAIRGAVISSITFDEGPHLAVGYATLRTGDFRLQPVHIHPPLINVLAAAPLLLDPSLPDPRTIPGWEIASLSAVTDAIVWKHIPPDGIALAGRLPIILMAMLLGAFVYRWASDLAGRRAGLLALFLYALDPNIVAHSQAITTDMGVTLFGFIAFYLCFRLGRSGFKSPIPAPATGASAPDFKWSIGIGAAVGAALVSKVTAGLVAPLVGVIVLLTGRDVLTKRIQRIVVIGLTALVVVWATYGFEIARVPGLSVPIPAATHVKIYQSLQQHYDEGHPSFLMGMNSTRGWWYYFFVAFVVKTPLPTLILLAISIILALARGQRQDALWTVGVFPIVHFATTLFSSVDIGYRHLLPILPFVFVFIGWQVARKARKAQEARGRAQITFHVSRLTFYTLLAWSIIGTATIFPHDLAFFNEIAGGPDGGYNWLVDSNLDWGQNLKELRAWLEARGIKHVYLSQFSPARPEAYGLQATMLLPSPHAESLARFNPAPGWYAIGATTLQGAYTPDVDTFAYFRVMTPTARIGHALFIYHVPEQLRGEWVAQCSSPSPPLDAGEIEAGFGRDNLRLVQFDCSTSWWYPAGDAPGWYLNAPRRLQARTWYPSATAVFQPRNAQAKFDGVYRVNSATLPQGRQTRVVIAPGDWPPAQAMSQGAQATAPVTTTGPLQFEGFWLYDNQTVRQILVFTVWRVTRGADAPLSIMAHLLDAQGRVIAGSDGLGVPIEVWQTSDMIVQAHSLNIPGGAVPGTYWIETGVYRLDNIERYQILQEGQAVGDRLLLASVEVKP